MSTIVTRAGKGSPLENSELDLNFTNLNTDKLEINAALGTPASVTLTNATGLPTAGLVDNAVTNAKLRDSAGLSVIGRGANSTGDPADIVAGTNKQVLRREGSDLAFGAVDLSSNQAVTGTLPVNQGGTGITSFGSGVAAWLGTPTSANLATAVTDETGTGALVFGTNPVIDGATIPARLNPLAQAVSVQMTAAASGSNGIRALDNANLDMGTNDFTLHWEGSLSSLGVANWLIYKIANSSNYYRFLISSTNVLAFRANIAAVGVIPTLTVDIPATITAGANLKLTCVVVRETASAAGSVTFYVNGIQTGAAQTITAAATTSIDNAGSLYVSGSESERVASNTQAARLFNRALTAAEVLSLSINGPALADRGGTQTAFFTSNFSAGADGFVTGSANLTVTGNIDGISGVDDTLRATATANSALSVARTNGFLNRLDKVVRIRFDYFCETSSGVSGAWLGVGNSTNRTDTKAVQIVEGSWQLNNEIIAIPNDVGRCFFAYTTQTGTAAAILLSGKNVYFKNVVITQIGLTSELIASNAQSDTGQIFDTSGNKNHALLPASGATVVGRPVSQTREVRWTNTWAGTNELQYIGGVNQAILPANAYIESIVGTVSGATPHDIIVGDGSDADRYVTITTGLAAGTTSFTLAARTTDGTNLKLTVDPDTDATMSIAWVISYRILE